MPNDEDIDDQVENPKPAAKPEANGEDDARRDWDKDRQKAEQDRANLSKQLSKVQTDLAADLAATKQTIAELRDQLNSAATKADVNISDIDKLDPEVHGADLVHSLKTLKAELEAERKNRQDLQKWIDEQKQRDAVQRVQAEKEALKDEILSDLDEQFGAKYRNEAIELANQEVAETGKAPATQMQARKLLAKYYKSLKDKDSQSDRRKTSRQDNLGGTVGVKSYDGEEGDFDSVVASMKKKGVFASLTLPG